MTEAESSNVREYRLLKLRPQSGGTEDFRLHLVLINLSYALANCLVGDPPMAAPNLSDLQMNLLMSWCNLYVLLDETGKMGN
jgi:hypothetical protein